MTELQIKAKKLRDKGLKYREIAEILNCSIPGAWLAVNNDRAKKIRNKHRGVTNRGKWVSIAERVAAGESVPDTEFYA